MTFVEFKDIYAQLNTEEEKIEFINSRIRQLIEQSQIIDYIGIGINGSYDGFIAPNVGVVSNGSSMFSKLVLDDMEVYKDFLDFVKKDSDNWLRGEPSTINAIQYFIWNYFGYNAGNLFRRMDIYGDGEKYLSVKKLKGKNIGACSERSALVQNILKFLGFNSELIFGTLNDTMSHSYVIFKSGNGKTRILYDPMNPVIYETDNVEKYCPGVCFISEYEYQQLKEGKKFNFNYDLVKKIFVGNGRCLEYPRNYLCDEIKYNLNFDDSLQNESEFKL